MYSVSNLNSLLLIFQIVQKLNFEEDSLDLQTCKCTKNCKACHLYNFKTNIWIKYQKWNFNIKLIISLISINVMKSILHSYTCTKLNLANSIVHTQLENDIVSVNRMHSAAEVTLQFTKSSRENPLTLASWPHMWSF